MMENDQTIDYSLKSCFIVTPVGEDGSQIRREADGIIDAVIRPVISGLGFKDKLISVAHRMPNAGSITKQIITSLVDADLVIANLTGLNPNVMYEVAVRHAARKPIVQICHRETKLPFDMAQERTIFYINDIAGTISLSQHLRSAVSAVLAQTECSNPIYDAIRDKLLQEAAIREDGSPLSRLLLERISGLEKAFREVSSTSRLHDINPYHKSYVLLELVKQTETDEVAVFLEELLAKSFQIVSVSMHKVNAGVVSYEIIHIGVINPIAIKREVDNFAAHYSDIVSQVISVGPLPF